MKKAIVTVLLLLLYLASGKAQSIKEAQKLTVNENYESASTIYKALLSKNPDDAALYYYYAENLLKSDNADSARILFEKGKSIDRNNTLIKIGEIKILMERINLREAKSASEKDTSNTELRERYEQANANVKEANTLINEVISKTKDVNILIEAAESMIHYKNKDTEKAKEILDKAAAIDPKNIEVLLLYGDVYTELNNGTLAADYYNRALDLDKSSARAIVSKGRLYKRSTNYEGAIREFENAISIDSAYAPAYRELGETYIKMGKLEDAKKEYKKYLELSKNNCSARIRYATFLYISKNYAEALNELNQVQQRCDSNNSTVLRVQSYCFYETHEYEKGLNTVSKLFRLVLPDKRLAKDWEYYGKLLIATDKDSSGIEQLQKALIMEPTRFDLLSELAVAWMNLKQYNNAIRLFNQKIANGKEVKPQDYFNLGKSYFFLGQFAEADSAIKKANEISPAWTSAWLWRAKVNANIDSTSEAGLAKPFYEKYLELALPDSSKPDFGTRFNNGLIEAYGYLAYYYILKNDTINALIYLKKKLTFPLDPEDRKNVQKAIDQLEGRGPKPKK